MRQKVVNMQTLKFSTNMYIKIHIRYPNYFFSSIKTLKAIPVSYQRQLDGLSTPPSDKLLNQFYIFFIIVYAEGRRPIQTSFLCDLNIPERRISFDELIILVTPRTAFARI